MENTANGRAETAGTTKQKSKNEAFKKNNKDLYKVGN